MKSGIVTMLGRPNVGKSTLINHIVGEKISIVTPKPQTTRFRILGVKNYDSAQVVFVDTPGFHIAKSALNRYLVDVAIKSLEGSDLFYLVIEVNDFTGHEFPEMFKVLENKRLPVFLVINKIDLYSKEEIEETAKAFENLHKFAGIFEISALTGKNVNSLLRKTLEFLPEGPAYFPEGTITDVTEELRISEIIREKAFIFLSKEIPYNSAVTINQISERENGMLYIAATISVAKESQKGIVIGAGGKMVKKIGTASRLEIEALTGKKVFLDLNVQVIKDWPKSKEKVSKLGYTID